MAIRPQDEYPGQTLLEEGYPLGAARNKNTAGDTNGTPLERTWVNDLWGFEQALLDAAGFDPSGTPDKVGASQYLTAIQKLISEAIKGTIPERVAFPLKFTTNTNARWDYFGVTGGAYFNVIQQNNINDQGIIRIPLTLPFKGARIAADGLNVYLKGAPGHGAMPQRKPEISLSCVQSNTGVNLVSDFVDPLTSTGSYEVTHPVRPTMNAFNIQDGDEYWLQVKGEMGTNSVVGLQLWSAILTIEPQP